jgi:hypothetical protein
MSLSNGYRADSLLASQLVRISRAFGGWRVSERKRGKAKVSPEEWQNAIDIEAQDRSLIV